MKVSLVQAVVALLIIGSISTTLLLHNVAVAGPVAGASVSSNEAQPTEQAPSSVIVKDGNAAAAGGGFQPASAKGIHPDPKSACRDLRQEVAARFKGESLVAGELPCHDTDSDGRYSGDCIDITAMVDNAAASSSDDDSTGETESTNFSGQLINGRQFARGTTNLLRIRLRDGRGLYGLKCDEVSFLFFNRPANPHEERVIASKQTNNKVDSDSASASAAANALALAIRSSDESAGTIKQDVRMSRAKDSHRENRNKQSSISGEQEVEIIDDLPAASKKVHAFYYPWYGNPDTDGAYKHWNHEFIPHWDKKIAKRYPPGKHDPDHDDLASGFYPRLGAYSSADSATISDHMRQLRRSGCGVAVMSWYPAGKADDNGGTAKGENPEFDRLMFPVLDAAQKHGIELAVHIEPYEGRDHMTVRRDLIYIADRYGSHPALHRYGDGGLPVIYLYDSYRTPARDWAKVFGESGSYTVRGTESDAFIIGLAVERKHLADIRDSGFDGVYTYFAADKFSYGSTPTNWGKIQTMARTTKTTSGTGNQLVFVPSVGPGYIDTAVRPWNSANTKSREGGLYYEDKWKRAIAIHPEIISITSFNEWHEGSQIEEAKPMTRAAAGLNPGERGYKYLDYSKCSPKLSAAREICDGGGGKAVSAAGGSLDSGKGGSTLYLDLTRYFVKQFDKSITA